MRPRLRDVHRLLIVVFGVFSLGFGVWAIYRHLQTPEPAALASGIGFIVVAVGCVIYLRRSPYLRR